MQIFNQENLDIDAIVDALKEGKTIVYPTETCYGLGCDATNKQAVNKVFQIKQRQEDKPVLMLVPDEEMALKYVIWNEKLESLSQKYWPGPLTVVVHAVEDSGLASGVEAEDGTVAFRVTNHPLVSRLSTSLGKPLVSTSANIASLESPYDSSIIIKMFENQENQPDIIINAGELPYHSPSTVVRVSGNKVNVLRQGEIILD